MADLTVALVTTGDTDGLLERTVAQWRKAGIEPLVVESSGRPLGTVWGEQVELCGTEWLWLACDDVYPEWDDHFHRTRQLELALSGRQGVRCPVLWNPDGTLQGAGGHRRELPEGAIAANCAFPLARTIELRCWLPFPPTSWFVDCWITERAMLSMLGPFVSWPLSLVHERLAVERPGEWETYLSWRDQRIRAA